MSLGSIFRRGERPPGQDAIRLIERDRAPDLLYAVGDIHGCHDKYSRIEAAIVADAERRSRGAVIVVLGDVVDRGPDSRAVIEHLLAAPPHGIDRFVLSGNHEAMMASFFDRPSHSHTWLSFGGAETLMSYGIDTGRWQIERVKSKLIHYQLQTFIPAEHMSFVAERPHLVRFGKLVCVHAAIDRSCSLSEQTERDLLWTRPGPETDADNGEMSGYVVVHGHTPVKDVFVSPLRINLDTGAFAGGPLSAARFVAGHFDGLISSAS
ncbi:MAG: metallophosphoesterase [Alphaproteobacteria bacterium]|nr:metallophosphoesterase [Alphaproteobacteria bacterium]